MYDASLPLETVVAVLRGSRDQRLADIPPQTITSALRQRGAVLLRGFGGDLAAATQLTERLGRILKTVEVTGTQYVGYHGELTYTPFPPDLLCFFCDTPPGRDGETMLCDGIDLLADLSDRTRAIFERHVLSIASRWDEDFLCRRLGTTSERLPNVLASLPCVRATRTADASWELHLMTSAMRRSPFAAREAFVNSLLISLHDRRPRPQRAYTLTLDDGADVPSSIVDDLLRATERQTCLLGWQPGDYAVVDNARMMHGRRPTDDCARRLFNMHVALRHEELA